MIRRMGLRLLLAGMVLYCLAPFLWQVLTSLKTEAELGRVFPLWPERPTLANYAALFSVQPFWRILLNSLGVAGATTALASVLGASCAFGLSKLEIRGRGLILGFVLSVSMFPPISTISPLFLVIRALGLRDTWWALILTYTTFSLPLAIWVLTHFIDQVPDEILKAARVDGCTPWQTFTRIVLPLAAPGVFTTAILVFIAAWSEFLFALTFTATPASRTVPVAIALFSGRHEVPWGEIAAASIVATVPLLLLVFAFQKRIVEGLTAGALKG